MSRKLTCPEALRGGMCVGCLAGLILLAIVPSTAATVADEEPAKIRVHLGEPMGLIRPTIFGHFTEMTLTSFQGTVWSEMLFNRKFGQEDPSDQMAEIRSGTSAGWEPLLIDTDISLHLDNQAYYSPPCSQRITVTSGKGPAGIRQRGLQPVLKHLAPNRRTDDPFHFQAGTRYKIRLAVKQQDFSGRVYVALGTTPSQTVAVQTFEPAGNDWKVYECVLTPSADVRDAAFMVYIDSPGTVWIDSVSLCQESLTEEGFRKDALDITKDVQPTVIRWPGGCFADDYHWKDGIGPLDARADIYNRAWKSPVDNDVGTDEFIALCRLLGAEPYICVNYGTGSPEEAADWVEYCNGGVETRWGKVRAENGHPEPYGVKYWNIGNELYLPTELGATNGTQYGKGFKRFAQAMRAVDPDIQLVAVGCFDLSPVVATVLRFNQKLWPVVRYHIGWTRDLMREAGEEIDLLAIHYYEPNDVKEANSLDQVNAICMAVADDLGEKLDDVLASVQKYAPEGKRIPIALDEWATWTNGGPQPPSKKDIPSDLEVPRDLGLYCAAESLRTALAEAGIMNLMQRRPDDFALGCKTLLYAYLSGEIGVRRDAVVASPCALMMGLYSTHETCQALKTEVESKAFRFKALRPRPGGAANREARYLDTSARLHPDGKTVDVFVVNRNLQDDVPCRLEWIGAEVTSDMQVNTLNADDIFDWNTFDKPDTVSIKTQQISTRGDGLDYPFPAHSITRLTCRVK